MSNLIIIIACVGIIIALMLWMSYKLGKNAANNKIDKENKEVANEQAKIAVDRPSKSDVVDSLRNGKF
jgi:low temperature requirement protein LtrA